jgi:hypothetical protein
LESADLLQAAVAAAESQAAQLDLAVVVLVELAIVPTAEMQHKIQVRAVADVEQLGHM